jgi:rSAM/selenodomain-associated transferase 1
MTDKKNIRIIVFAKAPQANFAKTRLIPALGAAGAANIAYLMLKNTLSAAIEAGAAKVELCMTPDFTSTAWQGVKIPVGVEVSYQGEGDLGERMECAAQRALLQGEAVILIGTDCIEMSAVLLIEAIQSLDSNDTVIYPTADGGYALLGLRQFDPSIFSNIAWSTSDVAYQTILKIKQLDWSIHIGNLLHDVDTPDDLEHAPEEWLYVAH